MCPFLSCLLIQVIGGCGGARDGARFPFVGEVRAAATQAAVPVQNAPMGEVDASGRPAAPSRKPQRRTGTAQHRNVSACVGHEPRVGRGVPVAGLFTRRAAATRAVGGTVDGCTQRRARGWTSGLVRCVCRAGTFAPPLDGNGDEDSENDPRVHHPVRSGPVQVRVCCPHGDDEADRDEPRSDASETGSPSQQDEGKRGRSQPNREQLGVQGETGPERVVLRYVDIHGLQDCTRDCLHGDDCTSVDHCSPKRKRLHTTY